MLEASNICPEVPGSTGEVEFLCVTMFNKLGLHSLSN